MAVLKRFFILVHLCAPLAFARAAEASFLCDALTTGTLSSAFFNADSAQGHAKFIADMHTLYAHARLQPAELKAMLTANNYFEVPFSDSYRTERAHVNSLLKHIAPKLGMNEAFMSEFKTAFVALVGAGEKDQQTKKEQEERQRQALVQVKKANGALVKFLPGLDLVAVEEKIADTTFSNILVELWHLGDFFKEDATGALPLFSKRLGRNPQWHVLGAVVIMSFPSDRPGLSSVAFFKLEEQGGKRSLRFLGDKQGVLKVDEEDGTSERYAYLHENDRVYVYDGAAMNALPHGALYEPSVHSGIGPLVPNRGHISKDHFITRLEGQSPRPRLWRHTPKGPEELNVPEEILNESSLRVWSLKSSNSGASLLYSFQSRSLHLLRPWSDHVSAKHLFKYPNTPNFDPLVVSYEEMREGKQVKVIQSAVDLIEGKLLQGKAAAELYVGTSSSNPISSADQRFVCIGIRDELKWRLYERNLESGELVMRLERPMGKAMDNFRFAMDSSLLVHVKKDDEVLVYDLRPGAPALDQQQNILKPDHNFHVDATQSAITFFDDVSNNGQVFRVRVNSDGSLAFEPWGEKLFEGSTVNLSNPRYISIHTNGQLPVVVDREPGS